MGRGRGDRSCAAQAWADVDQISNARRMRDGLGVERNGRAPGSMGDRDGPGAHEKRTDRWQGLEGDCKSNQRCALVCLQGMH